MTNPNPLFKTTEKALNAQVQKAIAAYRKGHQAMHVAAVLCLYHAAVHGQPAPLNLLAKGLVSNDRTALRNYIRRIGIVCGLGLKDGNIPTANTVEMNSAAYQKGQFLTYSAKDGVPHFGVVRNGDMPEVANNKKRVAELCETQLMAPAEKSGWMRFLDRNNFAETRVLGDNDALSELARLAKKFTGESSSETIKLEISPRIKKFMANILSQTEQYQAVEDQPEPIRKAQAKAKTPPAVAVH